MRRNRQKEKTPDASGHMAAAPGVCCYLFVLVCEIEFMAVIVRIRHTFQLGKGLLGQRPHIPVHTRHGCGDLAYRPASVCVVVHTDQIVVVEKGRIAQQGTHEQLMKQEGIYKRFVDARQQAVSWKLVH